MFQFISSLNTLLETDDLKFYFQLITFEKVWATITILIFTLCAVRKPDLNDAHCGEMSGWRQFFFALAYKFELISNIWMKLPDRIRNSDPYRLSFTYTCTYFDISTQKIRNQKCFVWSYRYLYRSKNSFFDFHLFNFIKRCINRIFRFFVRIPKFVS